MSLPRKLLLIVALAVLPCQAQKVPSGYSPQPLPDAWAPSAAQPSRLTLADVAVPAQPPLRVSEFIARFGAPDRYLVPTRPLRGYSGMLVYNLQSGHTVILYVSAPPLQSVGAIAVLDKDKKQVRLIK